MIAILAIVSAGAMGGLYVNEMGSVKVVTLNQTLTQDEITTTTATSFVPLIATQTQTTTNTVSDTTTSIYTDLVPTIETSTQTQTQYQTITDTQSTTVSVPAQTTETFLTTQTTISTQTVTYTTTPALDVSILISADESPCDAGNVGFETNYNIYVNNVLVNEGQTQTSGQTLPIFNVNIGNNVTVYFNTTATGCGTVQMNYSILNGGTTEAFTTATAETSFGSANSTLSWIASPN